MAKPTQPQQAAHDPRTCQLCASLRHPAQAAQGRALRKHLAEPATPQRCAEDYAQAADIRDRLGWHQQGERR